MKMQIKCLHLRNVHLKALIIVLSVFMQKTKGKYQLTENIIRDQRMGVTSANFMCNLVKKFFTEFIISKKLWSYGMKLF